MELRIILIAAAVLVKFDVPLPGSYFLFTETSPGNLLVEACGRSDGNCHVSVKLPIEKEHSLFWLTLITDQQP